MGERLALGLQTVGVDVVQGLEGFCDLQLVGVQILFNGVLQRLVFRHGLHRFVDQIDTGAERAGKALLSIQQLVDDGIIKFFDGNGYKLSDELEDFSQIVTTEVAYVYPGDDEGNDKDISYTVYSVDEYGNLDFGYSAYPANDTIVPNTFWKLSYEVINTALKDIDYEDYIITKCSRSGTVFVWVRSESEDLFLTYPSRPDLTGLKVGGIYTLEEIQELLTKAFQH